MLKNDVNFDQDTLTLSIVANVEHGSLTLSQDGGFTYVPTAGFNGDDQFTYRISDGVSESFGKVDLRVGRPSSSSQPLVVRADRYEVKAKGQLTVDAANGLAANDSYGGSFSGLTFSIVTQPAHGSVTLGAGGAFTYSPANGTTPFVGSDSFVYRLTDATGATATATASIQVKNSAPWVMNSVQKIQQGKTLTSSSSQLGANTSDADGHALTFSVVTQPTHGTLTFQNDGSFVYVPNAGYTGVDSFTWRASDGIINSSPAKATILVANEVPTLIGNSYRTNSGETLTASGNGVLSTASDVDGDTLVASVTQTTAHGTLSLQADGKFTYIPNSGFSGRDTFRARAYDGAEYSSSVMFVIDVENQAPVASSSMATMKHGQSHVLNLPAYDADGDSLVYELMVQPTHGTISYSNLLSGGSNGVPAKFTGTATYTPNAGYAGSDSLQFRVSDGVASSENAAVSISVINSAPVAAKSFHSIDAGQTLTVQAPGFLTSAVDADGDPLAVQITKQPDHGTLTLSQTSNKPNGGFVYTPNAGFAGVDSFEWRVSDGVTWSTPVAVSLAVNNSAPTLRERTFQSNYSSGTTVSGVRTYTYNLNGTDTAFDLDRDTVTFSLFENGAHGTATVTAAGVISYRPTSTTFVGQDKIKIRGFDGYSYSEPVTVSISINNTEPVALQDSFSVHHHTPLTITAQQLLDNDYDFDGDTMQIVSLSVAPGSQGTVTQSGSNWVFNPGNFVGTTTLTYVVSDGLVSSDPSTIEIDVTNTAAWAIDRSLSVVAGGYIDFRILDPESGLRNPMATR